MRSFMARQGYLRDIGDLKRVNEGMKEILPMAQFDAGKKVIIVAVLALFGLLAKLFMKKKDKNKTVE
jgi:hypothetical protein